MEKRRFRARTRTSTEALDANDFLADGSAMVEIALATGTVLGRSRIDWTKRQGAATAALWSGGGVEGLVRAAPFDVLTYGLGFSA